jgi:DNA polymerase III alpha subunit (gram-positive type)
MRTVAFDTETTGLIINPARSLALQPEIISLAAQEFDLATGEKFASYYQEFKPTKPVSEEITKITGFTNDHLNTCPSISVHLNEITIFLERAQLLIGQNITFDKGMFELELKRYNKRIIWPKSLDLVENTIHLKGFRLNLTALHETLFGVGFESAHLASADVDATVRCAIELYRLKML